MQALYGPISGHKFLTWIETNDGLVAIDTGWDVADGQPYEESDVEALVQASEESGKPLTHILLTHDHWDHCANLPLLRARWPEVLVYAHANSSVEGVTDSLYGGETLHLSGVQIKAIYTPGHSINRDELCYYLADYRFLFCGDVAQPQGPSYAFANGVSPVPFFYHAEEYRSSLEKLIMLNPLQMRTGHGDLLGPEQVKQWLRVTLATVMRIEELALTVTERYPNKDADWLAELLYDYIVDERHFALRAANKRKRHTTYGGLTDYERFDKPGLLSMIMEAKAISKQ